VSKQTVVIALKYGLGFGLLALVICLNWHQEKDGVEVGLAAAMHRPIDWAAFVATVAICAISILITFIRWYILVRAQQLPFTMSSAFRLGLIGLYWNTFLPGSVGGDIIKAAFITREQSRRTVAVATVLLDRVVGLCGLFWLVTLLGSFLNMITAPAETALAAEGQSVLRYILIAATALSAASLACWLVMGFFSEAWAARMAERLERTPKIGVSLAEFWRAVWLYRRRGKSVTVALVLAIVGHGGFVLSYYFAAQVLSPPPLPSLPAHFLIVPVGMTFQAGVPLPGGLGVGEIGFGWLYAVAGATFAAGALAGLVQRVANWLIAFAGYFVYLCMKATTEVVTSASAN
jgi:glycosyltransferase 2 family protein